MIDHVGIRVSDLERSKAFYKVALAPLGYTVVMEFPGWAGFGVAGKPFFWITEGDDPGPTTHVAFVSENRRCVDRFFDAALASGGKDNGKPGIREHYHPNYYGAFVHDPDGYNIEAVCHKPETPLE